MILTTYAMCSLAADETGCSTHYWAIVEGIAKGEKKVVIHEFKDGMLNWESSFNSVEQAQMYWSFLVAAKFNTLKARELYVASLHA